MNTKPDIIVDENEQPIITQDGDRRYIYNRNAKYELLQDIDFSVCERRL